MSKGNPLLGINRSRVTKLRVRAPLSAEIFKRLVLDEEELFLPMPKKVSRPKDHHPSLGPPTTTEDRPATEWTVAPGDLAFDGTPEELSRKIRRIHDNAHTTLEERGLTTLHITFGILEWDDPLLGMSQTPIWMVPAHLERSGQLAPLRLKLADEEMQLNPALELFLRERHKVSLEPLPEEPATDSLAKYLDEIRRTVLEFGWKVHDQAWLSTYTFESLVLYQDLTALAGTALQSRLVAALARAGAEPEGSEALGDDLDLLPVERTPIPILPTDSSQLEALVVAAAGRHLVVHGPPGTGKSQTITSLIADALARGQRVLFVSAKMAALDVVYRRLRERGLSDFCLEAHSTKAGKTKVIEELRRTLELETTARDIELREDHEKLLRIRDSLNAYVRALHKRHEPLGLSAYQGIGRVASLHAAADIRFQLPWTNSLEVSRQQLDDARQVVGDIAAQAPVFDRRKTHAWRGLNASGATVSDREAIEDLLRHVESVSLSIVAALEACSTFKPIESSLHDFDEHAAAFGVYAASQELPKDWRTEPTAVLLDRAGLLEKAATMAKDALEQRAVHGAVLTVEPSEAMEALSPLRLRFKSWWAQVTPDYWRWRRDLRRVLRPGIRRSRAELLAALHVAESCVECDHWIRTHEADLANEVGHEHFAQPTRLAAAAKALRSAMLLRESRLPLTNLLDPSDESRRAARELLQALPCNNASLNRALGRIHELWPSGFCGPATAEQASIAALLDRIQEVRGALPTMGEWLLLRRTLEHANEHGLGPFVDSLNVSACDADDVFVKRFFTVWTSSVIEQSTELATFLGSKREDLIKRFRELDEAIRVSVARHARAVAGEPASRIRRADPSVGAASEVGVLRKELGKRRRIKPLRRLFEEIPRVLQALKPCMLMSPISVSTYLKPGSVEFDLVVFDEASQLPTQEAVPSILRARQTVVAGDTKQLPPTTFFMSSLLGGEVEYEEEELESLEPLESLLDDCVAIVPHFNESNLRWHYRSRDERLIAFSNSLFYEGRLHTFPSASTSTNGQGVQLAYVPDGVYGRGKDRRNVREARVAAQTVLRQLERFPERSVGVVAMGINQKEAIEDALGEELESRPDLRALWERESEEPCFVKALENVQGDERDTMIISVGYGKDADGALTYNFGPLNVPGGERRLNVLITRAKWHTVLITSLRSTDLAGVNPSNKGASALRSFIAYAETGALPRPPAFDSEAETNDFEDAVREALIERGFAVDAQVGASRYRIDLAIRDRRDPTRYLLGVECDGATYHGTRTARDRDLLRQEVLRKMGWRIHRLWSTEWFRDPDKTIAQILTSVDQAERDPVDRSVEAPRKPFADVVTATPGPSLSDKPPKASGRMYGPGVPYRKYSGPQQSRDYLMDPSRRLKLAQTLVDVVAIESPIMDELLLERLREIHGIGRAGTNIRDNFDHALGDAERARSIRVVKESRRVRVVAHPERDLAAFRTSKEGDRREIDLIPRVEIALAVLYLVEDQFGMQRERIPSHVANLFGFERARAPSADRIRDVVDQLVDDARLRVQGPNVYIAEVHGP
jgi:very-short-patch-repair endonuclease